MQAPAITRRDLPDLEPVESSLPLPDWANPFGAKELVEMTRVSLFARATVPFQGCLGSYIPPSGARRGIDFHTSVHLPLVSPSLACGEHVDRARAL